jgi:hypothetical protein
LAIDLICRSRQPTGNKESSSKKYDYFRALKRRKVNKKELIDGNAGLIFGNYNSYIERTFAHRDQVVG